MCWFDFIKLFFYLPTYLPTYHRLFPRNKKRQKMTWHDLSKQLPVIDWPTTHSPHIHHGSCWLRFCFHVAFFLSELSCCYLTQGFGNHEKKHGLYWFFWIGSLLRDDSADADAIGFIYVYPYHGIIMFGAVKRSRVKLSSSKADTMDINRVPTRITLTTHLCCWHCDLAPVYMPLCIRLHMVIESCQERMHLIHATLHSLLLARIVFHHGCVATSVENSTQYRTLTCLNSLKKDSNQNLAYGG